MHYDFIGINNQVINGVKNPMLTISGTILKANYEFLVLCDGKKNDFVLNYINGNGRDFVLNTAFSRKVKIIEVYVIIGDEKYLISKLNNKSIRRILRKFKNMATKVVKAIAKFCHYIKATTITFFRGIRFLWREHHFLVPPKMWKKYWRDFKKRTAERAEQIFNDPFDVDDYNDWINNFERRETEFKKLNYNPLISILIPVYNINKTLLSNCLDSILKQKYEKFEVCLVDDCSTKKETKETLEKYAKKDKRIRVQYRKENGNISAATNDALRMAKGEFVALADDDDEITEDALYEVVKVLNQNKKLDFIYSDEDKIDSNGKRQNPNFKPDWSPDTLLSLNYICHLSVIRKKIVDEVGGFTVGLEGAQDYDLFLKVTEKTQNIYHIPKILYHWRMIKGSTSMKIDNKSYALQAGKKALENALKRRKIAADVEIDEVSTYYKVTYKIKKEPLVSIIIPTKDYAETLDTCLKSIYKKTTYKNYEVIVVNNNSEKEETFALFEEYKKEYKNFKVIDANYEFNYSKINNQAINQCKGEFICLLNNDTEIISDDWLKVMVGYAMQPHVGTVGPKLLYPDNTVQHGGIILGLGGVASHAYIGAGRTDPGIYGRLKVPYNYAGVTAACLVIEKRKMLEVGLLEEDLKVAYNDVDLNIKLLKKGYYNLFVPQIEIYHFESKSRGLDTTLEKLKRFNKEQNYMWKKWENYIRHDPFYNENYSKRGWFVLDRNEVIEYGIIDE